MKTLNKANNGKVETLYLSAVDVPKGKVFPARYGGKKTEISKKTGKEIEWHWVYADMGQGTKEYQIPDFILIAVDDALELVPDMDFYMARLNDKEILVGNNDEHIRASL